MSAPGRRTALVAVPLIVCIILAGCGGGRAEPTSGGAAPSGPAAELPPATATVGDVIPAADAQNAGLGQDPSTATLYNGVGGFTLDTARCAGGWDNNGGITDTSIKVFTSTPNSGALAAYGAIAAGMNSYFTYVNSQGGVAGRTIQLDIKDDQLQPDLTRTNVEAALAAGDYAAGVGLIGTANGLAVRSVMNQQCLPMVLTGSSDAQFGDPQNYPWTTGFGLTYVSEAAIWAEWLKAEYPDGVKVAMIVPTNDLGSNYTSGFESAIAGTGIELVSTVTHDTTAPNLSTQLTTVAASGADVLLLGTFGSYCTQGVAGIELGTWKPQVIMSQSCVSAVGTFKPLISQGLTGDGTQVVQWSRDAADPALADNPFVQAYRAQTQAQGLDSTNSSYALGWIYAWYFVAILQNAETYAGGLNRANIMLAARAINTVNPLIVPGLPTRTYGNLAAYLVQGGQMYSYRVSDPARLGSYESVGPLITLDDVNTYEQVTSSG